jgi:hypothetical protein
MPSAKVASLFAVESMFFEQVRTMYDIDDSEANEEEDDDETMTWNNVHIMVPVTSRSRSSGGSDSDSSSVHENEQEKEEFKSITVPIGFHKPWWYHSNALLLSPEMQQACPYLPFVFTSDMSRVN